MEEQYANTAAARETTATDRLAKKIHRKIRHTIGSSHSLFVIMFAMRQTATAADKPFKMLSIDSPVMKLGW